MKTRHPRAWVVRLLPIAPAVCLLTAASPLRAGASGAGVVTVGPASFAGGARVSPGDRISAGYDLAFAGAHPSATVHASGATATLALSCRQNSTPAGRLQIPLADGAYAIASGDTVWHATSSQRDAAGYQGGGVVPDLCGGARMWVDTHSSPGVTYAASLQSSDTHDVIQIRFHAIDAGINCGATSQNPAPGSSACDAAWSAVASSTAALTPGSSAGPGSSGSATGSAPPAATPGTNYPTASTSRAAVARASAVAGLSTHRPVGFAVTPLAAGTNAASGTSPLASGELPLAVVLAPAGGGRNVGQSPSAMSPIAAAASWVSELPIQGLALVAGADVLLAVAIVVRRRRAHQNAVT